MQNVKLVSVSTIIYLVVRNFTIFEVFAVIVEMKRLAVPNVFAFVRYSINEHDGIPGLIS